MIYGYDFLYITHTTYSTPTYGDEVVPDKAEKFLLL